ncbi:MAG: tRNA uridine-5-carboxymethylaminomethyl(34) synthesis GTPase MnmE [Dethiobacter sp.]|jgi:tRNA modification GTPase|nr:tRNA uridine-5-carboxymethylaminomethyl(34) synthesis GTPase MnmE [Dethiobacter sp.]
MLTDTIAAISTPPGEGGIGIVRMSGPQAKSIGLSLFCFAARVDEPQSHRLYYGHIMDIKAGLPVDEALISFMHAPHTYTREDVVEINCHGGILPLARTLELALAAGARLAQPGEFTQRAFLNGRLDLAQAEAVIHIIRAKTEAAMELGLSQLQGRLSGQIRMVRQRLLDVLAHIEASIDFPEHQDVEDLAWEKLEIEVLRCRDEVRELLATADKGRILREGLRTAIVGRPNVGKSSLLNSMLREQRAIVTAVPGTTRDVIEESVNIGGVALTIIDTAGIRKTADEVEKIGVARSKEVIRNADLVLLVIDAAVGMTDEDREILSAAGEKPLIIIANKTDLLGNPSTRLDELTEKAAGHPLVAMSLLENSGLDELEDSIIRLVFQGEITGADMPVVASLRHKDALRRTELSLEELMQGLAAGDAVDLLSIDLYTALETLGEVTGETVRGEIVEEIFKNFCIGK